MTDVGHAGADENFINLCTRHFRQWFDIVWIVRAGEQDHLRRGAEKAGRSLADLEIAVGGAVGFGDVERMVAARKPGMAFTLGAMGSPKTNFYNDAYKRGGFEDAAIEVQRLWVEGKREEAAARVPDEMIIASSLLGTEAVVRERIRLRSATVSAPRPW